MKALVYTGPERIEHREVEDPVPADGEALVKVEAVGICGSDMHAYLGHDERRPPPLILGHEAAGTVLSGALRGRRVTVNPLVTCGACAYCEAGRDNLCVDRQIISMAPRPGAFAELLAIPERNLIEIPDHTPTAHAALVEPLACGWRGVSVAERHLDRPLASCRVVVLGGGAIGVGAALAASIRGAVDIDIVETNLERRALLADAGPFRPCAPEDAPAPGSADLVIDAFGGPATRAAATALARPGGAVAHIGLADGEGGLDMRRATLQEIAVFGIYTYTRADFRSCAQAVFGGRFGTFGWVARKGLEEGPQAFADLKRGRVAASKIVLNVQ